MVIRAVVNVESKYLTARQICQRFGNVSLMWLRRRMANDNFPRPIKFGGPTSPRFFLIEAVEKWERAQAAKATAA